jgi:hypothetical protein
VSAQWKQVEMTPFTVGLDRLTIIRRAGTTRLYRAASGLFVVADVWSSSVPDEFRFANQADADAAFEVVAYGEAA